MNKYRSTLVAAAIAALALPVMAQQTTATTPAPAATSGNDAAATAPNTAPNAAAAPNRYNGAMPTIPAAQTQGAQTQGTQTQAAPAIATPTPPMPMTSRARMTGDKDEKDRLEQALQAAQNRNDYRSILEKNGWKVSAINADKPDYLEYEIVKGDRTYEVQLDFKDNVPKATKIDVTANMWRAESTKKMMKDEKYAHSGPMTADPEGRYSDRRYMKDWSNEKEQLEKALAGPNMKPADYRAKLEQLGYKVTSVNDRDKDYVEYEIVKGNNSYEVQVDLDPATRLGKKVDVTTNVWETDATERAKGDK